MAAVCNTFYYACCIKVHPIFWRVVSHVAVDFGARVSLCACRTTRLTSMAGAVALDRWEAFKVAWKASRSDWGYEDVEATAQDGQLPGRAPEGPAVALLHSDAERREFISAGAAAGLAASPPLCSYLASSCITSIGIRVLPGECFHGPQQGMR